MRVERRVAYLDDDVGAFLAPEELGEVPVQVGRRHDGDGIGGESRLVIQIDGEQVFVHDGEVAADGEAVVPEDVRRPLELLPRDEAPLAGEVRPEIHHLRRGVVGAARRRAGVVEHAEPGMAGDAAAVAAAGDVDEEGDGVGAAVVEAVGVVSHDEAVAADGEPPRRGGLAGGEDALRVGVPVDPEDVGPGRRPRHDGGGGRRRRGGTAAGDAAANDGGEQRSTRHETVCLSVEMNP